MRYAIVGNNDGPLRLLQALLQAEATLPVFIGLQKKPEAVLLKKYQKILGLIPFYTGFDEALLLKLLATQTPKILINCFCNFKFTRLLSQYTCYNIHPSYLPHYRGRHPMHWALINGEKTHGISLHKMNEDYDDGPILWQAQVPLNKHMSVAELRESLMKSLAEAFPALLEKIVENSPKITPNTLKIGSYHPPRKPIDSKINKWDDARQIYRLVMALRSEPNPAFLVYNKDKKLTIINAKLEDHPADAKTSETPALLEQKTDHIIVKTLDHYQLHLYFKPQEDLEKIKINFAL